MPMNIKPRICQHKWQLEHHSVSNCYFNYQELAQFVEKCHFSVFSEPAQVQITL